MNINELKNKLIELRIPKRWYSINGNINSDIYLLNEIHGYWEFLYIDERGNQTGYKKFDNEDFACTYFLEKIVCNLEDSNKKDIRTEKKEKVSENIIYL